MTYEHGEPGAVLTLQEEYHAARWLAKALAGNLKMVLAFSSLSNKELIINAAEDAVFRAISEDETLMAEVNRAYHSRATVISS